MGNQQLNEVWKDIRNFEGYYQISKCCRGLRETYRNSTWEFIKFNDYLETEYTQVSGNMVHPVMDEDIV